MDKGKSKTDLRAAGKKRLEEFRQKKNQKGGGTGKAIIPTTTTTTTTTTALKALTETEQGSEDNNGQEANSGLLPEDHSREDRGGSHIDSSEETLVSCTKGSEEETVLLGGSSTVAVDPSLISPIQTVRPEAHLSVEEASEQCDSLSQPGSAEQGSQCESERERKAVYTILWETPTTDSTQTNEDWQENTYEGTEDFTNKGLDQGNYSTFRLEDNFAGQNRDGLNSKEHSNGVGEYADDNNVQLFEETTQKDLQETLESKGFRDNRCVDPSSVETLPRIEHGGQPTNGVGLLKREEVLGDENLKGLVEEQARVLDEKGRDIDGFRNEIEASTLQSEKEVQIQIENADKERQQFIAEIEEVKTQMQEMVNERKQLLQAASDREMLLISELGELRAAKDEENSQFVLQLSKLHQQLEELGDEKSLFVERYNVTREMSDNLHSENLRLVEESAHEQRKREVSFSMELATWKDRVEDLEKERLESQGSIKELSDRLKRLESDLREVEMLNSHVQDEKKRLESDLQEVEMLNSHVQDEKITLMAQVMELNQSLQAVEEEKTQLGIERDELKDKSIESALVVEELHLHIQTLEMQGTMHVTELAHLNESLKSLGDEKVEWVMALNDSKQKLDCLNLHVGDLEKAISDLESSNRTLTQELQSLGEEETQLVKLLELSNQNVEALKLELQGWENDKSTYLSENEALSEQLQGLKQDKVNLEKLLDDSCREMESLMSQVQGLEEVRRSYVSEEALLNQRLQGLEEEKAQLVTLLKDSGHQVDALNLQVQSLQDEISVLVSKDIAAVQGLQRLEEEKIQAVELLEDSNKKMEILSLQAQSLEGEMDVFVSENKRLQQQLQGVVEERSHIVKCLEDATSLVQATLKSQCSSTMDERQDLLSMLSALQQHNLDMSEERDRLMGDLQIAREHIRMLETQKEELGLRALKSEEDAKSLREEGQELMMQLDSSRQEVTKMAEERLECEKQQLVELNQGMEQWSNERNELVKELEGHNQQVARLAEERLKLLEEIENSQQEVQQLGCRMIESKEERRQVEEQLKSELQLLHQKLQISESEKTDLKTLLGNLRQELQQTIEDQGLKPVRLEELSKHLQSETKEHALTLKKLQEVFDEKEHLISELEASRLLLQETQAERKQAEHELQLLQEKLETDIEEKGCLVNEVEESRLHARDLSVGNAKLSSRLEQLQEVCRKREEENTHLQALVKELEQQTTVQRRQTSVGCMENASSQSLRLGKSVEDEEAWPSREATDALQQERDAGIQTEQALRVQLEGLLKSMQDSNDERSDLTASLMELEVDFHALWQQNVEWADQMSLDIEALKETKAELSGFVDELKGEIVSLQKSEEVLALTFAEIERKATDEFNARLQTERQSQSLASKLQDVEMELGKLKDEHANAGEKLEKSVLERCMLEEGFKELQDAYTQLIQDKAALETLSREEKAQHDMNLEHLKLEAEECNQKLNLLEEQKTLLQQEKESIFLDFTIFRSDVEKRMMESDAVVAKLNDDHAVFQTNLQAAVCRTFPDTEGKQQDVVGTSFESCWKLVDLLVDKSMQLVGLQTQLQEAAVEEKAQYAATLQAMEAKNDVLKQTNKELSSKVQILALEVEQAAGEEEQLRQTLTSNMLEIHTLQTEKQDLLAVQDSEVMGLKQQLEEVTLRSVQQDEQLRTLMQQKQTLEADISKARGDYSAAQTEVVQMEKKLSNTKERLTLAISKGKSVVQQRDAVKQALKEKTEDLERLISSHAESIRAKDMALHEAEVKASSMAAMADRASLLDVELAVAQDTILSLEHTLHEARSVTQDVQLKLEKMGEIPQELGLAAKIEWLAATLTAEQSKAEDEANNVVMLLTELGTSKQESETLAEQVAELNSKCVELEELVAKESSEKTALASELAIAQDTILSLENALHKARSVTQDVQLKLETMGDIPLELGLVAKIEWLAATLTAEQSKAEDLLNNAVTLLTELGTSKQESETLTKQVAELNGKCVKLEELVAEESSEKTALASEIDVLQRVISDRDLAMEAEVAAHLKLQLDISVAMKLLDSVFQDQMFDAEGSHPRFSLGLVESAIARIVEKYRSEACKVEELTHQIAVMAQEAETAKKERDLSMDQRVQQMREMLDYTELELSKTVEKVREAAIIMTQQDKENQVLVQQAQKMQSELLKTSDENVALQADIVMTKKRLSDVRDRLLLGLVGMDVDGGDVSQGESPAQPLSEKAGEIQALADLFCLEMQKKDAALQESNERSLGMAATVSSLQLELDSLRRVSEECKQILLGFTDDATSEKAVRWPNEVSLSSITFPAVGMKWLINTLNEEQQKASQAMHEVGRLEKAVDSVTLEIKDQKGRLEELSNELTFYKEENHGLAERLQVLSSEHTTLGEQAAQVSAERDAMKVEMLALENSLQANQEREHLEGYLLARSLEEMLKSAKLELSELSKKNTEMTAALVQHDDDIKGLLQECARLDVESSEARREADAFRAEMLKAVDEKDALQAELNQMEQKLSNTREKLGLAVKKGKAVEKQRDALKMSLEEKTQELNSICISHKEELKVQDAKLHESREKFKSVAEHVLELEFQLTSTLEKVTAAEQSLQDSQKFQQEVNIALSHISLLPSSLKTSKVIEKIEWLGMMLGKTQSMAVRSERELEVLSLKLREVQEKVQFLEMENSNGKEMILSWAKKVDEAEIRAASDRAHYESELEFQSQALWEAEARTHAAVAQVEEMQGALEQKQNSLKSMEASRGKAISKLTLTLNRLTELRQQSEGLVAEIENLHGELQNRDAEIIGLKEKISNADAETQNQQERFSRVSAEANLEILKLRKELTEVNSRFEGNLEEMTILQNDLTQKTLELEKLQKHLEMMVLSKEDSSEQAEQSMVVTNHISRSAFEDVDTANTNGTVDYVATIYALQQHIDNLKSEGQLWRVNMERKDAQLQGLREELDELVKERALLQAGIQAKQFQIDRMQADMAVLISPASDSTAIPTLEIEELGVRSKRISHVGSSAAPHVRGARKLFPAEVTIDVDGEINPLLSDLDDKGHGFNSLTNSALVPKRMRALADRLDGLCVVGGRLLMRQPTARLGLAVYWIAIHVYMAMIVSRAIL